MTARVLRVRRERSEDFSADAKYQPLVAQGSHLGRLLAFRRGENLIAVVPRFTMTLAGEWGDTRLPLPGGSWRNCFTDECRAARGDAGRIVCSVSGGIVDPGSRVIFSVWAPHAKSVDLLLDETSEFRLLPRRGATGKPMYRLARDRSYNIRWMVRAGLPDPRSRWQPDGRAWRIASPRVRRSRRAGTVRGSFRAVPLSEAIIYELHVGTFNARRHLCGSAIEAPLSVRARRDSRGAHAAGDLPGSTRLGL